MSKKVWKIYNLAISGGLLLLCTSIFSQSKTDGSTTSSSISMPEMPSVSMPSIGSGFYSPARSDFYNPNLNRSQTQSSSQNTSSTSNTQTSSQNAPSASSSSNTQNTALNNAKNLNTAVGTASASLNQLTADDISSMNNLGVFSQISGLLRRGSSPLQTNTLTANTVDSQTLQQILSELTSLKNQLNANSQNGLQPSLSDKANAETSFSNVIKKEPKILRFNVNGYDLLATCKKIYFSELETDGTFLLTGDRKYMSENKARSETFYFYFRANGTDNGITKYSVTPAVSQDYENQYSYLYQLTQKSELSADRTGNLVTLRASDKKLKMDLLISLDK